MKRSLKVVISFGFLAVARLRGWLGHLLGEKGRVSCVVLYYHAIPPEQRQRFARQMDMLQRWAKPIRADIMEPLPAGQNYAAVTFDDGFQSVAANALPELHSRQIPTTIFVVTGCLGQSPGWLSEGYLANESETTMTAEHLRALNPTFVAFGSHTVTHPRLTRLSVEEARREIEGSRRNLEKLVNQPVSLFSFPYGLFSPDLVQWCREAGYQRVFTTEPLTAFSEPGEFLTGRVSVNPTDWPLEFWLKLLGSYRWQVTVSALKRKFRSARIAHGSSRKKLEEDARESTRS